LNLLFILSSLFLATYLLTAFFQGIGINLDIYTSHIMIISTLIITPKPDKRQAVIEILESVKNMTRLKHGCISCDIFKEYGEGQMIFYIEKWQDKEDMYRHIRSNLYLRVLNAIELADKPPEIYFHEDSETKGIELIEALRGRSDYDGTSGEEQAYQKLI
jgi:quinol monooxygenase YgiN